MFTQGSVQTAFRACTSITADVGAMIEQSGVTDGLCHICVPHRTAALAITSFWDPRGLDDLMDEIDRNFPSRVSYHCQESPYSASGQVKSAVFNNRVTLPIHQGKLILGSSQGLVVVEFDGPRLRDYDVQIIPQAIRLTKCDVQTEYMGMHDLTEEIAAIAKDSGVQQGLCHVSVLHSTAGLVVSARHDERIRRDVMEDIERIVPTRVDFKHRETASDAGGHVKTALTGTQISFAIEDGQLGLSPEQGIVFAEYDGPRPRNYYVSIFASGGQSF